MRKLIFQDLTSLVIFVTVISVHAATYDDAFTTKTGRKQVYIEDINVWVYTTEFAKRFGMPKEWIDDSLKGAYAAAFRVETPTARMCNLFGNPEICQPNRECIIDLYLDSKAPLPWKNNLQIDFVNNNTFSLSKLAIQDQKRDRPRRADGIGLHGTALQVGKNDYSSLRVILYDRNAFPGITFISFNKACTTPPKIKAFVSFNKGTDRRAPEESEYVVELPESFMQRLYENWYQKERRITEQEVKQNIPLFQKTLPNTVTIPAPKDAVK